MKKVTFAILTIIVALLIPIIFLPFGRQVNAVTVKVKVKDYPEHGLKLIDSTDPSFQNHISAFSKGTHSPVVDSMKLFSVLLKNVGDKAIVGYWMKWELVKADGTIVTCESGGINPAALMDGGSPGLEHLSVSSGYAIRPGSTQLVSPSLSLGEDQAGGIGMLGGGYVKQANREQIQQAAQTGNLKMMMDQVARELQNYKSINVSLDGAFFEDGTFVGDDSTNYFAKIQANIDAKRDLLEEIAFALKHNDSEDEIFDYIKEVARQVNTASESGFTPTDYYSYQKRIYAEEMLRMRDAMGGHRAITVSLQALRKPWPKLKKLPFILEHTSERVEPKSSIKKE
ncbi:MAG TPA: hypothetical protein VJ464_22950 [Blastocatellia bacterium]|nr:hypothetical protein [Blastocatellia bacterium]